jgi:hypothetical protein
MITAYLLGIPSYLEGEDIQIRFQVFQDGELLMKESFYKAYRKPLVVSQVALSELLERLEKYKREEITIVISDPALYEQINNTSTTKNRDVIKMSIAGRKKLARFGDSITIKEVSNNKEEFRKWNQMVEF